MPCTTVPCVLVVKPMSLKPIPPSLYVSAVDQVWPPSLDRKSQLAPEAVARTRVPGDVAASAPLVPPVGAFPTTVAAPFLVTARRANRRGIGRTECACESKVEVRIAGHDPVEECGIPPVRWKRPGAAKNLAGPQAVELVSHKC